MASALYPKFKKHLGLAQINLSTAVIKAHLMNTTYAYSASHETLTDLGANILGSITITTQTWGTVADNVFDCDDLSWPSINGAWGSFVLAVDTGTAGTSYLIVFNDSKTGSINGGTVDLAIDAQGVFAL